MGRHAHGYAHGMDDLYFVLRMRVSSVRGGFTKLYFGSNQNQEHENLIRLFSSFDDGTGLIKTVVIKQILVQVGLSEPEVNSLLSVQNKQGDSLAYKDFLGELFKCC